MAARQNPCYRRKSRRQSLEAGTGGLHIREQKLHWKQTKFSVPANAGRQKSSGRVRTISQEIARGRHQFGIDAIPEHTSPRAGVITDSSFMRRTPSLAERLRTEPRSGLQRPRTWHWTE